MRTGCLTIISAKALLATAGIDSKRFVQMATPLNSEPVLRAMVSALDQTAETFENFVGFEIPAKRDVV
jgi:hypothetical protein